MNYSCEFIFLLFRLNTCEIFSTNYAVRCKYTYKKNIQKIPKFEDKKYHHFPNPTSNAAHRLGRFLQRWTGLGCTCGKGRRWGSGLADRLKMLDEKKIMIFLIQRNVKRSFIF